MVVCEVDNEFDIYEKYAAVLKLSGGTFEFVL
jgi:hypothetical protein